MNIPSRTGTWGQSSVANILNNEVYLGKIRWKYEPTKRILKEGFIAKKRIQSKDYELYDGLHEAIITEEQWEKVKLKQRERNHASVNSNRKLVNPFATILLCEKCGAVMRRNVPAKTQKTTPWYRCPTRECNCRAIKCDFAEEAILKEMQEWLKEYTIKIEIGKTHKEDSVDETLTVVQNQLAQLRAQQDSICEYLEKGIYTIEIFSKRNEALMREIRKLQGAETNLLNRKILKKETQTAEGKIIPTTQKILDSYPYLSPAEKNHLWKLVMEKITIYRTPEGEFSIHIYPKLPMKTEQ